MDYLLYLKERKLVTMSELKHYSVLLSESINLLQVEDGKIYLDCTVGGGGHSSEILKRIPNGFLYGFDQDSYAIEKASSRLNLIGNNYKIYQDNFVNLSKYFEEESLDGIIYDLGVSSFQFDLPERGFSYRFDGPLDMRMDQQGLLTATDVVNNYSESELIRIFRQYGEEKYANSIAKRIVRARETQKIETTFQLVDIIKASMPAKELRKPGHPAKQVFQALRIEVNHELTYLEKSLEDALKALKVGGILVVITFHSLEDRIVKQLFKKMTTLDLPKGIPFIPEGYDVNYEIINSKIILPSEEELRENNRSHSAKLRAIQRIKK